MYHSETLNQYIYRRTECQQRAIDAVVDVAEYFEIDPSDFARFLRGMGIDCERLEIV
jgi:hypothetical protein